MLNERTIFASFSLGDGFVKHDISQITDGKLYFYSEKRWNSAKESSSCEEKLSAAEFSCELNSSVCTKAKTLLSTLLLAGQQSMALHEMF
jgi:hypothetical protein